MHVRQKALARKHEKALQTENLAQNWVYGQPEWTITKDFTILPEELADSESISS